MKDIIEIGTVLVTNHAAIIESIVAVLGGLIAIALIIPGDQPEKALTKALEFVKKFSRK